MRLRRCVTVDKYLYEILEDYKNADTEEERETIFQHFCSCIWASSNQRMNFRNTICFTVRKDLANTEIGQIFDAWSKIEYSGYKSRTTKTDWCSLIRQKVNNLYTRYFDPEIILNRDYMDLLGTPKKLYYQWADGAVMQPDELRAGLADAMRRAETLKASYVSQKIKLPWNSFRHVAETIFRKIFSNCKSIEACETGINMYDFINEDNFYTTYFCRYLELEMKQWQKKYYGVKSHKKYKRCRLCGSLMERTGNRRIYCADCAGRNESQNAVLRKRKQRQKKNVTK